MKSAAGFSIVLMAVVLLGGCKSLGPAWRLSVENWESIGTDPAFTVQVCTGELTATVRAGTAVSLTATAEPGGDAVDAVRHEGILRVGDPVWLEATCTDEAGSEVGFTRIVGRLGPPERSSQSVSTFVNPPAAPGAESFPDCLPPTEARGRPPCIAARLVIPN